MGCEVFLPAYIQGHRGRAYIIYQSRDAELRVHFQPVFLANEITNPLEISVSASDESAAGDGDQLH